MEEYIYTSAIKLRFPKENGDPPCRLPPTATLTPW